MSLAIRYGCADPDCGYSTVPSTMGTPYAACPLCGFRWVPDPPPQHASTGRLIVHSSAAGKVTKKTVVRPHLREAFDRLEREAGP